MNVLIIGGTGVISAAVSRVLLDAGCRLTLFNRGRTPLAFEEDVRVLVGDRTERDAFTDAVRRSGPWDCVIDMICSDPDDARALRDACSGIARQVVFCSTTNVYPKPADCYPVPETHRLAAAYKNGIDKIACETVHREAETESRYAVTVIRPGHCYGERSSVLHSLGSRTSFLDRLRQGKEVVVHSDGNGLWSALHVDDVAHVFAAAAGCEVAFAKTYNACAEEWMTWSQYCERVATALGAPPPTLVRVPVETLVRLCPERANHVQRSLQFPGIYDMRRAQTELGVRQRISFTGGMRRTIAWLDQHDRIEPWQDDPEYERIVAWAHNALTPASP